MLNCRHPRGGGIRIFAHYQEISGKPRRLTFVAGGEAFLNAFRHPSGR